MRSRVGASQSSSVGQASPSCRLWACEDVTCHLMKHESPGSSCSGSVFSSIVFFRRGRSQNPHFPILNLLENKGVFPENCHIRPKLQ